MTSHTRFQIAAAAAVLFSSLAANAQTAPPQPAVAPQGAPLTFDQYKTLQRQQLQRAQALVSQRLAAQDLPPDRRQRLEHQQSMLARFAGLSSDQQDQLLHRRFDRLDANHDGMVDGAELQALRQARRDRAQAKRDASGTGGKNDDFWPSQN